MAETAIGLQLFVLLLVSLARHGVSESFTVCSFGNTAHVTCRANHVIDVSSAILYRSHRSFSCGSTSIPQFCSKPVTSFCHGRRECTVYSFTANEIIGAGCGRGNTIHVTYECRPFHSVLTQELTICGYFNSDVQTEISCPEGAEISIEEAMAYRIPGPHSCDRPTRDICSRDVNTDSFLTGCHGSSRCTVSSSVSRQPLVEGCGFSDLVYIKYCCREQRFNGECMAVHDVTATPGLPLTTTRPTRVPVPVTTVPWVIPTNRHPGATHEKPRDESHEDPRDESHEDPRDGSSANPRDPGEDEEDKDSNSEGSGSSFVIGGVIGGVTILALLILIACLIRRRKQKNLVHRSPPGASTGVYYMVDNEQPNRKSVNQYDSINIGEMYAEVDANNDLQKDVETMAKDDDNLNRYSANKYDSINMEDVYTDVDGENELKKDTDYYNSDGIRAETNRDNDDQYDSIDMGDVYTEVDKPKNEDNLLVESGETVMHENDDLYESQDDGTTYSDINIGHSNGGQDKLGQSDENEHIQSKKNLEKMDSLIVFEDNELYCSSVDLTDDDLNDDLKSNLDNDLESKSQNDRFYENSEDVKISHMNGTVGDSDHLTDGEMENERKEEKEGKNEIMSERMNKVGNRTSFA